MTHPHRDQSAFAERSIVQIIAEELRCAPPFAQFMVRKVLSELMIEGMMGEPAVEIRPRTGAADDCCDITARIAVGSLDVTMMISVRFASPIQAARRLRARSRAMTNAREASLAPTFLITTEAEVDRIAAGEQVHDRVMSFDAVLRELREEAACASYELKRRREFHIAVMEAAVREHAATALLGRPDHGEFWSPYFELMARTIPEIGVDDARRAGPSPAGMVAFDVDSLPSWSFMPSVRLAHHLREGVVSILIHDWGADIETLAEAMAQSLDGTPYHLAQGPSRYAGAKPGALLFVETATLDPDRPFGAQAKAAERCAAAILDLRSWFVGRKGVARYWAEAVAPRDAPRGPGRVRRDLALG